MTMKAVRLLCVLMYPLSHPLRPDAVLTAWQRAFSCSYDHIYGLYITRSGRRRRMDIIVVPPHMWVFALLGWTGSKQWLRFLRAFTQSSRG